MATLSPAQIAQTAYAAGLRDQARLATAVAIALGESGGNPQAHNPVGLDDSYGLWQINMRGAQGPERRAALGIASNAALFDPATNARAMMMISKQGTNFRPWTVYTRGIYLAHLPRAREAARAQVLTGGTATTGGTGGTGVVTSDNPLIPDAVEGTAEAATEAVRRLAALGSWAGDRHNWLRVAYVIGGGALLVTALVMAGRDPNSALGKVGRGMKKLAEGPSGVLRRKAGELMRDAPPVGPGGAAKAGARAAGGAGKVAAGGAAKVA